MALRIRHETVYEYESPVNFSTQYLRLLPRNGPLQQVLHWELSTPQPWFLTRDLFYNQVAVLTIDKPTSKISIVAEGVVDVDRDGLATEPDVPLLPLAWFLRSTDLTEPDQQLRDFAAAHAELIKTNPVAGLEKLSESVLAAMPYRPGTTSVATSASQALAKGSGVCQDHTHVFLTLCRLLNLPARYISGYVYSFDDEAHLASHAWAEVRLADGWHGFDVSNSNRPGETHVQLALGLDYMDACPIRGVRRGGDGEQLKVIANVMLAEE
ncbi:transglutaminase family protein [Leeia sp. TBRC 13508]|uniref:Transglutaminase family protein n=1 Tax=Leeia speluncae TaxID=2884804 RepID=A0ABS8D7I0_9NEIS|nr:transglutaminase family protein [Leeia speluncae]MCB6184155.1 transglutaminase family protein [Leeia speluncae]